MKAPDAHLSDPLCEDLRSDLFLYAEGELACPASRLRVRRHLESCAACQDRLWRHDALTRAILAEASGEAPALLAEDARADRIMDLVLKLAEIPTVLPVNPTILPRGVPTTLPGERCSRREVVAFPRAPEARRPPAAPGWRARAVASVAAALLVAALLGSLALLGGGADDRVADRAGGAAPASRDFPAREPPGTVLVALDGAPIHPPREEERTLWVALPRDRVLETLPPEFPVRLLGFGVERAPASGDVLALEWVVEAVIDERPSSGKRVFLVPEGSDLVAVEIAPRAWLERGPATHRLSDTLRPLRGRPAERERAYRAYVLEEPGSLGAALPRPLLGSSRPFLPASVQGGAPREWVLPARWRN